MRTSMLLLVAIFLMACPALVIGSTDFDTFIKTREIVATLYFDVNAEDLSKAELERLNATIQDLRQAQKNGRMLRVEGFSSTEGDKERNFILSFFRARSVADIIEAEGLDSEIALTGYGDLMAGSDAHAKERRVEIASYVKPVGMKKIKVADKNQSAPALSHNKSQLKEAILEIDSYRVDQAIRYKVEDKGGLADQHDKLNDGMQPGLSLSKEQIKKEEIERGYSLWRQSVTPDKTQKVAQVASNDLNHGFTQFIKSVTPGASRGLTHSEKTADDALKRGYSQVEKSVAPETSPGLTQSEKTADDALKRGYSQVEKSVAPETSPGLTQSEKTADDALKRGYSQVEKSVAPETSPGLTQSEKTADDALKRGYSQVEKSVAPETSPGLTQSEKTADDLKRGYSQIKKVDTQDSLPGVTMVDPFQLPVIDALMIEQAIMEKIGMVPTEPSAALSQVDVNYRQ